MRKSLRLPGTGRLLNRILADPGLPERVKNCEPQALAKLINDIGLEDCGEIVALAGTEQLQKVFDLDLWRSARPGEDEGFDPERFGLWLEILLELGAAKAAERISAMDPEFVTMAFSQLIWVTRFDDLRTLAATERGLEKLLESSLHHEFEEFILFARNASSWDATLCILAELDSTEHSFLIDLLETCARFTAEAIEEKDGLSSVLTSEEQLMSDVAYEREKRREAQGFVTPADARAFLKLASGPLEAEDHVTPKHLLDPKKRATPPSPAGDHTRPGPKIPAKQQPYQRVQAVLDQKPSLRAARLEELNYLANVLVSGAVIEGESPRPGEAAQIVLRICEAGLARRGGSVTFIEAFRAGWLPTMCLSRDR